MELAQGRRRFDLQDRTLEFAARVRALVRALPGTLSNGEDGRQLIRACGSVGANCIEASNALSKSLSLIRRLRRILPSGSPGRSHLRWRT